MIRPGRIGDIIHRAAESAVRGGDYEGTVCPATGPCRGRVALLGSSPPPAWPNSRPRSRRRRGCRPGRTRAAPAGPPGSSPVQAPALPPPNPAGGGQPAPPAHGSRPWSDSRADRAAPDRRAARQGRDAPGRPTEPTDVRLPFALAAALRLADARPLMVAAAQAGVWVAEAQLTRARVLWVPTLNIGFDYTRHDGGGPDFNKGILTAPSVNFFYGGAGADPERRPSPTPSSSPWPRGRTSTPATGRSRPPRTTP